ncbi:hypothetical protein, partial [Salmonella sp. s51228]|uniref:hypothetical protein n=1 Tax=Salmonella sp. s51228 TaxID=3159652 RepID=UPI0039806BB0
MEQWLPAIHGNYPLSTDEGCIIAACLYHLNSNSNQVSTNDLAEFLPNHINRSQRKINNISTKLSEMLNESYDDVKKLCIDTI